jgi:hypothetical protein
MRETRGSILLGRMEWRRYESERRATRMLGVNFEIGISEEKSQTTRCQSRRITHALRRLTVFPLWLNLYQHLLLTHHLDNLSNITPRLLQKLQLLSQQPHPRIQCIPLGFKSSQVLRSLVDCNLGLLDLVLVVALKGRGQHMRVEKVERRTLIVHAGSWPFVELVASIETSTADCVAILGMLMDEQIPPPTLMAR